MRIHISAGLMIRTNDKTRDSVFIIVSKMLSVRLTGHNVLATLVIRTLKNNLKLKKKLSMTKVLSCAMIDTKRS